jgi:hypothetical protein
MLVAIAEQWLGQLPVEVGADKGQIESDTVALRPVVNADHLVQAAR